MAVQQKRRKWLLFLSMALVLATGVQVARVRAQEPSHANGIIRGTVRDQHQPRQLLYGILVTAKAEGKNVSTSVFTDEQGEYVFPPLAAGQYVLSVGTEWRETVTLASAPVRKDFAVELGPGFFNQTSGGSFLAVLPGADAEKKNMVSNCGSCHSIWRLVDRAQSSPDAWRSLVRRMGLKKGGEGSGDPTVAPRVEMDNGNFEFLAKYYAANIHPDLKQRGVVEAMFRPRGEGAKAVFTEWDLPPEMGGINTAKPDSKGMIWFPAGRIGVVARLDPHTGEVKTWAAPMGDKPPVSEGAFHDIMVDQQDNVWVTGGGLSKIFKLDTKTFQFSVWDIPEDYGLKPHTGELDAEGNYWVTMQTGKPGKGWVVKLDPRTGETAGFPTQASFPHPYGPEPYGLAIDRSGTIWFTELFSGKLGKIDPKTGKMTEYSVPNPAAGPRRLDVDSKGNLWFTECFTGQIAKFDPRTEKFTEYDLGVAGGGFPYSLRIDESDQIWFTMNSNNSVGKLDPATGKITYTLFPIPESNTIDPDFDPTAALPTLVYGTHRSAVGRVYFRP